MGRTCGTHGTNGKILTRVLMENHEVEQKAWTPRRKLEQIRTRDGKAWIEFN